MKEHEKSPDQEQAIIIAHIDGYFEGKIDEIEVKIDEVKKWPSSIKLGSSIKRKDQEIENLEMLKKELERAQKVVVNIISGKPTVVDGQKE